MSRLIFSKAVDKDISSSIKYIKNMLEAPMASQRLYDELEETYLKLEENPYRRPLVQNKFLAMKGYRSINVKNYKLFYIIIEEDNTVLLVRFMHSRMDWVNVLINEFEEE